MLALALHDAFAVRANPRKLWWILLAVPLSGCLIDPLLDAATDKHCSEKVAKVIPLSTPADPSLQLKIDSCRVDVDACPALCQMALERTNVFASAEGCKVGFEVDTVNVRVEYTVFSGGNNCPIEASPPEGVPTPAGPR